MLAGVGGTPRKPSVLGDVPDLKRKAGLSSELDRLKSTRRACQPFKRAQTSGRTVGERGVGTGGATVGR
jgi:hypothetical protein